VAAQFKEVVVNADAIYAQQLRPEACDELFGFGGRSNVVGLQLGPLME
jgi:hypothetical protein